MSQVQRTLWEFLQRKPIDYYMDQRIEGIPQIETERGELMRPTSMSFFMVGNRMARLCLSGPVLNEEWTTTVYYDSWEEVPGPVAEALQDSLDR